MTIGGRMRRAPLPLIGLALVLAVARWPARAQAPIVDNGYDVELVVGPVLSSPRILGVGGAYAAIAEGVDGANWNPAGAAARAPWEHRRVVVDPTGSFLLPGGFSRQDYFNNDRGRGIGDVDDFVFLATGLRVQIGDLGIAGTGDGQLFSVVSATGEPINVITIRWRLAVARALLDGDLIVGLGVRLADLWIDTDPGFFLQPGRRLATFAGFGGEAGAIYRPRGERFRLGATLRTPIRAEVRPRARLAVVDDMGVESVSGLIVPFALRIPVQLHAGFAWQAGPRPFNVTWSAREEVASAERRYARMPRRHTRVSADILIDGPTPRSVGTDAFLDQQLRRAGQRATVGVRVGLETEPWEGRLRARAGAYWEPARNTGVEGRLHQTAGFDLRLFHVGFLDASLAFTLVADLSERYFQFGAGVGLWR